MIFSTVLERSRCGAQEKCNSISSEGLDDPRAVREAVSTMKTLPLLAATAAALLSLSACQNKPEEVDSRAPDPNRAAVDAAPKKALPPSIEHTVTFRCQPGNTLLYVDFYKEGKLATLKTTKDGLPVALTAPEAGQPYVAASGEKITGNHNAATIITKDGGSHSCKA